MNYLGWSSSVDGNLFYLGWLDDSGGGVQPTGRYYFDKLGSLGYTGTLQDRHCKYLAGLGYTGQMNDVMKRRLVDLGYSSTVQDGLKEKATAEGFSSVSEMWNIQGMIPKI